MHFPSMSCGIKDVEADGLTSGVADSLADEDAEGLKLLDGDELGSLCSPRSRFRYSGFVGFAWVGFVKPSTFCDRIKATTPAAISVVAFAR